MTDEFNLQRFISAQDRQYADAIGELRTGRKRSHWMWFVFPQIEGLGHSAIAQHYAIRSLAEARAYLYHPLLGARLKECTLTVIKTEAGSARDIFGYPDDLKFHSCMTLFAEIEEEDSLFEAAIAKYYDGKTDAATLDILQAIESGSVTG